MSLQLAHCKLCRQGVPNKQVTRANITCSTLFLLVSSVFPLQLHCFGCTSGNTIPPSCISVIPVTFRDFEQVTEIFLTPLLDLYYQTGSAANDPGPVCTQTNTERGVKQQRSNWGTDLNRKAQKGGQTHDVQASSGPTVIRPHKIPFRGSNLKNGSDTDNRLGASMEPKWVMWRLV